ncbi:AMP-dependent synthetase/ligase [Streptomyces sp. NPDC004435]|uniref:AMP-dependent synthetase/ligase n=1 Tax=Streptomyces sp. NPDC004435 TaxID=3364701 RepID=UPI0036A45590
MSSSGLRQISIPPAVDIPRTGGLADTLSDRCRDRPDGDAVWIRAGDTRRAIGVRAFREDVMAVAKGLLAAGVGFGDRVGVMCRPRYEWTLLDFALWSLGALPVPVPHDAPVARAERILRDAGARACVVEDVDQAMTVGPLLSRLPGLRDLWQLDSGAMDALRTAGAWLHDEEVEQHRRAVLADTPATVVHTAGTTGAPKACLLTHGNLRAAAGNLLHACEGMFQQDAVLLLHTPFDHPTTRVAQLAAVMSGAPLAYQGPCSSVELGRALRTLRPSLLLAEPPAVEGLVAGLREAAETEGRVGSFSVAVDVAVRYAEARERRSLGTGGGPGPKLAVQHELFDRNLYAAFRESLGGRLRNVVLCGSGLRRRMGLLCAGAGLDVHETYGLAETTGTVTLGPPGRTRHGTAGRPLPGTSLCLDEDEQIWVRGPQTLHGYVGDRAAVRASHGWLPTGDIGRIDDEGYLTVAGRLADTFVTAAGVRIVPTPLEDAVRAHPLVGHCVVVGEGRPFPAALVTLDLEAVAHWLHVSGRPETSLRRIHEDRALQSEVNRAVVAANKSAPPGSAIRAFRLLTRRPTVEHGLLTSSMRPIRARIEERLGTDIEALYSEGR